MTRGRPTSFRLTIFLSRGPNGEGAGRPPHLERSLRYAEPDRGAPKAAALRRHGDPDGGVLGPLANLPETNTATNGVPDGLLERPLPPCPHVGPAFWALVVGKTAYGNGPIPDVPNGDPRHQQPKIPDVPWITPMPDEFGHGWIERRLVKRR